MKSAWSKGSFTVEASLLMAILIPLLVGMMYLGFYLHNRAFLQGAACELAQIGLLYDREEDAIKAMEQRNRQLLDGYLPGGGSWTGSVSLERKEVQVTLRGSLQAPGMAVNLFLGDRLTMQACIALKRKKPALSILRRSRIENREGEWNGSVLQER